MMSAAFKCCLKNFKAILIWDLAIKTVNNDVNSPLQQVKS